MFKVFMFILNLLEDMKICYMEQYRLRLLITGVSKLEKLTV